MVAVTENRNLTQPIKLRAVFLGAVMSVIFSAINGYLSINLGWSFSYGAVAVILGYSLFHRLQGGSCRREISFLLITSVSQMGVYQTLGLILYMLETEPLATYPAWLVPSGEVIAAKDLSLSHWLAPIGFLTIALTISLMAGFIFYTVLRDELNDNPKMIWPTQSANTKLVDACMEGGGSARLVAISGVVGLSITFLQQLLAMWGIDLTAINLSGFLPPGSVFVINLSIGFAAIGYLITPNTSLSVLGSGLFSYLVVTPLLVRRGMLEASGDVMTLYNDYLMNYSMGPAIGILLLGGILLSMVTLVRSRFTKIKETDVNEKGYIELYKALIKGIIGNRVYLFLTSVIFLTLAVLSYILNPFAPLNPLFSVVFAVYCFFIAGFMEMVFISRMQGETGIGMGTASMMLYDAPIFAAGYRGFTGYFIYPYLRPNPWLGSGSLPYHKYRNETRVSWRDIVAAKIIGWVPTFIFSIFLTLILWKYVGFGTEMMPAAGLIQSKAYITMLATGNISTVMNPWTFIAGGLLGSLLEVFTPISMMGVGMGLLLPPHYVISFGIGGFVRLYTSRLYGKEFYNEKGRLIVTGLMASGLIVQVIMSILQNFV